MRNLDGTEDKSSVALLVGFVGALVILMIVGRLIWAVATVPTTADALRLSLQAIQDKSLSAAIASKPNACSIKGTPGFGWSVECIDIEFTSGSGCRSVSWDIDLWGAPSNGMAGRFESWEDKCRVIR